MCEREHDIIYDSVCVRERVILCIRGYVSLCEMVCVHVCVWKVSNLNYGLNDSLSEHCAIQLPNNNNVTEMVTNL